MGHYVIAFCTFVPFSGFSPLSPLPFRSDTSCWGVFKIAPQEIVPQPVVVHKGEHHKRLRLRSGQPFDGRVGRFDEEGFSLERLLTSVEGVYHGTMEGVGTDRSAILFRPLFAFFD